MIKLGITGGIGSGKSTVSELFKLLGIPVYIADIESKKLTNLSPIIRTKLIEAFGQEIYRDKVLNKQLLASYIFNDKKKLAITNNIIHPEVQKDFEEWLIAHSSYPIVAEEVAILFETGMDKLFDKIILVYAPLEVRIKRVLARDNTTYQQVLDRINSQMSDDKKMTCSDFIINNDGCESLIVQINELLKQLK